MKTILVPTEDDNAMGSALETALILARRCDSYIEGFALRSKVTEFTTAAMMGAVVFETDHQEIARMEVQGRATFESFMQKHGVPRSTTMTGIRLVGECTGGRRIRRQSWPCFRCDCDVSVR